jgi:hypothetical protein
MILAGAVKAWGDHIGMPPDGDSVRTPPGVVGVDKLPGTPPPIFIKGAFYKN